VSAAEQTQDPQAAPESPAGDLEGLDEVHGHICGDCRLAWVGGHDERELGLDPEISSTFSDSARAFAASARHISCADEEDAGHGYFDCLICDVTSIGGFKVVAYMVP
jgi:hypothetical protein